MSDQASNRSDTLKPWVTPEIQLLSVEDTHGAFGTAQIDNGPYPESQS